MAEIATLATIASAAFGAGSMLGGGQKNQPVQAAAPEPAKPVAMADPEDPRVKAEKMRQRMMRRQSQGAASTDLTSGNTAYSGTVLGE